MIDVDALFKTEAFADVSFEQKNLLNELIVKLDGKKGVEVLPILIEYSKKTPKGTKYSKAEESAMINAFLDAMPEDEKETLRGMLSFFQRMSQ